MNNWKESRIYKENLRNLQDTLQRARERNEQEYCERLKSKETPMLVDFSNFTYKVFADGKLYFCPKCCNMIIKSYFYCPTCGQRLLWANIYDTRATVEDGENADRKD